MAQAHGSGVDGVGGSPRVHVLGDSISMQYGPHLERMLAAIARYSRKTGSVGNLDRPEGANGGDSSMVLAYLRELAATGGEPFDLLLVNCGLHDVKNPTGQRRPQVTPEDYRVNLVGIVATAPKVARNVAWIRTTTVVTALHNARSATFTRQAEDIDAYNAIADAVMAGAGIPRIDLDGFTRTLGGDERFCDHVHFTDGIRALQAAFIAGHVTRLTA